MAENNTETLTGSYFKLITRASSDLVLPRNLTVHPILFSILPLSYSNILYLLSSKTLGTFSPILSDDDLASYFSGRVMTVRKIIATNLHHPIYSYLSDYQPSFSSCRWKFVPWSQTNPLNYALDTIPSWLNTSLQYFSFPSPIPSVFHSSRWPWGANLVSLLS